MARKIFWAFVCIAAGIAILLWNHDLISFSFSLSKDWPIILVALGILKLIDVIFRRSRFSVNFHGRNKSENIDGVLEDLEKGKITAQEAARKMNRRF